jgi:hypothetical protein
MANLFGFRRTSAHGNLFVRLIRMVALDLLSDFSYAIPKSEPSQGRKNRAGTWK